MKNEFYVNYENTPFSVKEGTVPKWQHNSPSRLNWRCEILLTRNREAIKDKKVLDLACHDGRFLYGCLRLGARHVIGVEARSDALCRAKDNFASLGYEAQNLNLICDDIFNYLPTVKPGEIDTILCFGFFYHTIRQVELLKEIRRIRPKYLILDTYIHEDLGVRNALINLFKSICRVRFENFIKINETCEGVKKIFRKNIEEKPCLVFYKENHLEGGATIDHMDLVAHPTKSFIELWLRELGFDFKQLQWPVKGTFDEIAALRLYRTRRIISYIAWLRD